MPKGFRSDRRKERRDRKSVDHGPLLKMVAQTERRVSRPRAAIKPRSEAQADYDRAIAANILTFGIGPAGTGKTWWAATRAAEQLQAQKIRKIIITRPAVEAGENLGFLPGELEEKYDPYFRPVRDALEETLGRGPLEYALKAGAIEVRPLAFLRGVTFKDCWVIADEMQNTTIRQMKMFLTRIGDNCKVIVNGDPQQTDIELQSGLEDAVKRLDGMKNSAVVRFSVADIVRSGICQDITARYER